jgi:S-adenosylmethionine:tRNA ribosyltransferase-isomerase
MPMQISEIDFTYPEHLVATKPDPNFRILLSAADRSIKEIQKNDLFKLFEPGDVLVINDTKVLKRRVFTTDGVGILFINPISSPSEWQVLFPARDYKIGEKIPLPGGVNLELVSKGLPQVAKTSQDLDEAYFAEHGEFALPPYIQKARDEMHNSAQDEEWYQTEWAKNEGSCAAPTASLHFTKDDLANLRAVGVEIVQLTLHVGIGTFLPIKTDNLNEHVMHKEWAHLSAEAVEKIEAAKLHGNCVWALGTTVARTLESYKLGLLEKNSQGDYVGATDLFIRPGFEWQVVDALLTNFHQPRSTLMALVAAFTSLDHVKEAYQQAIDKKFRLFSYGDLSVWKK